MELHVQLPTYARADLDTQDPPVQIVSPPMIVIIMQQDWLVLVIHNLSCVIISSCYQKASVCLLWRCVQHKCPSCIVCHGAGCWSMPPAFVCLSVCLLCCQSCATECPATTYGDGCKACPCQNGGSCDKFSSSPVKNSSVQVNPETLVPC